MKNLLLTLAFGFVSLVSFSQTGYFTYVGIVQGQELELEEEFIAYSNPESDTIFILDLFIGDSVVIRALSDNIWVINTENPLMEQDSIEFKNREIGLYNVRVSNFVGSVYFKINVTDPSASTSQNTLSSEVFKVYPSPATSEVKIAFMADIRDMPVNIFSLNGQLVYSNSDFRAAGFTTLEVNLTEFHSGIYFVKIGNHTEKLIIE